MSSPVLTGVGVGPGDPDLITVKGVKALQTADDIFVPVAADAAEPGYAERVVLAHCDADRITRLVFALGDLPDDADARDRGWAIAAEPVVAALDAGRTCAFATIGDPNVFATFTYLARAVRAARPDTPVRTVPGITAMQDLASRSGVIIAEGEQTIALLPLTAGTDAYARALAQHDTVVAYKGGRRLPEVRAAIERAGRADQAVFGARLGLEDMVVGDLPEDRAPYLSTVIVSRGRL